jgi:hypothetical protein
LRNLRVLRDILDDLSVMPEETLAPIKAVVKTFAKGKG